MRALRRPRTAAGNCVVLVALLVGAIFPVSRIAAEPAAATEPYAWKNVAIFGGGYVTAIIFSRSQHGLVFLRTDIGGAYRWDGTTRCWLPLLDWIKRADANLMGIESLATDPVEPNRVYLAAGTYTNSRTANGEILRSANFGRTWLRTAMPFKMGGNEAGRGNGERLVVDPNENRILCLGTRRDGLWHSSDFGATWSRVDGFPAVAGADDNTPRPPMGPRFNFPVQSIGIVSIAFDPRSGGRDQPTPVIYVAVSTAAPSVYRTTDAGATWSAIAGQPTGFRPNRLVLDAGGVLYVSYGKEPGPNIMTDGAVWRFDPKAGVWADITPVKPETTGEKFGYGAVSVDAKHPGTVVASTFYGRNEIYRSTNGGQTWVPILARSVWDHSGAPYTESFRPHWMGDIEIDPFNADHLMFTTGYGIWATDNAAGVDRGQPTRWAFDDRGLEETVPLGIISPPEGAHLLSGLGDIDGFRHDDLDVSPSQGTFTNPHYTNTESIDYAASVPAIIVRSGTVRGNASGTVRAAYSLDGGGTWRPFATEPPLPPESASNRFAGGAGHLAISADGAVVVWTPRGGSPHVTRDWGKTWTASAGAVPALRVVADRVNPAKFYGFDTRSGTVFVSADGGFNFASTAKGLPTEEAFFFPAPGNLQAVPGIEGDLWLAAAGTLFRSADSGATFARLGSVQEAAALGFGKAAPGAAYPAIFLSGTIQGRSGVFRSTDGGATWIQISDDRHQFAAIIHITGDPRIYGRVYLAVHGRGVIYGDPAK